MEAVNQGIPPEKRREDAVKKRISSLFHECRHYEEARLRQMLEYPRAPNVITYIHVMFQGEVVTSLREGASRDFLFTEEAWEKWPIAVRMLNGTTTFGVKVRLKEGLQAKDFIVTLHDTPSTPPDALEIPNIFGEKIFVPRCFAIGADEQPSG